VIVLPVGEKVPVHVFALQVGPVVADYDAVGVHHGEDPPLVEGAEFVGEWVFFKQEVDETVDDEGGVGLARVLSADDNDDSFGGLVRVRDLQYGYGHIPQRPSYLPLPQTARLQLPHIPHQIRVTIRHRIAAKNLIIRVAKRILER